MSSGWKSPATFIAIAGLVLSLVGNAIQFATAQSEAKLAEQRLSHEKDRWTIEKRKLEAEIEKLRSDTGYSNTRRGDLQKELNQVKTDTAVWESALSQSRLELLQLEGQLGVHEATQEDEMAEATRRSIALQKTAISIREGELEASKARRVEIEAQLNR